MTNAEKPICRYKNCNNIISDDQTQTCSKHFSVVQREYYTCCKEGCNKQIGDMTTWLCPTHYMEWARKEVDKLGIPSLSNPDVPLTHNYTATGHPGFSSANGIMSRNAPMNRCRY